jgi:hypothetical protein
MGIASLHPSYALTYRHGNFPLFPIASHCALRRAAVHPVREKYFASRFGRRSITDSSRPASTRGAFRDRHGRGVRDAVDAGCRETSGAFARRSLLAKTGVADGEVVWA